MSLLEDETYMGKYIEPPYFLDYLQVGDSLIQHLNDVSVEYSYVTMYGICKHYTCRHNLI